MVVLSGAAGSAGCQQSDGGQTGDDQNVTSACTVFSEREHRMLTGAELAKLNDPVAKRILQGTGCPTNYAEISQKLTKTDGAGDCDDPTRASTNVNTRFVSERAQELLVTDSYRAVVARACNGRSDHELLISMSGLRPGAPLPDRVELIGEDKTQGVFDFYAREDNQWKFFGSSLDFISEGYDCNNHGTCTPKAAAKSRCASCHVGGGLVMKELEAPWVNWEAQFGGLPILTVVHTPGVDGFFSKAGSSPDFGRRSQGVAHEITVRAGNDDWVPRRIEFLKTKGLAETLRPLFCTVDFNLLSEGALNAGASINSVNGSLFLDPTWNFGPAIGIKSTDYPKQTVKNGQVIIDSRTGAPMRNAKGPVTDTADVLTYPVRSGLDISYVAALVAKGIVDQDFVNDVLAVDFTRPIFSQTRCDLLQLAPNIEAAKMTPDAIRNGFKAALAGKTGAAATLLAGLNQPTDLPIDGATCAKGCTWRIKDCSFAPPSRDVGLPACQKVGANCFLSESCTPDSSTLHLGALKKYTDACSARPPAEMLADILTYVSHLRNVARSIKSQGGGESGQGIIEFSETLPQDKLKDAEISFDPVTCKLRSAP